MRWMGRSAEVAAYVAVAVALLIIAANFTVTRSGWVRQTVQKIAAQELANRLGRPVRLGPITGDVWRGVVIHGIQIDGPDGRPDLAVERVEIRWDLAAVLRKKAELPQTISRIRLVRPYIRLRRDSSGQWNFQKLLPKRRKRVSPPPQLALVAEIVDGAVDYDIVVPQLRGRRETGRLKGIHLTADLRHKDLILLDAAADVEAPYLVRAAVRAAFRPKAKTAAAQITLNGVALPAVAALAEAAGRKLPVAVASGIGDVTASVWVAGPDAKPKFALQGWAGDVAVVAHHGGTTIRLRAPQAYLTATASSASIAIPSLRFAAGSCAADVSLWDFRRPRLELRLTDIDVDVGAALPLLPPQVRKQVRSAVGQVRVGRLTGTVTVAGQIAHPAMWTSLQLQGPLRAEIDQVSVSASSVRASAVVYDVKHPAVAVDARVEGVRVAGLPAVDVAGQKLVPEVQGISDIDVTGAVVGEKMCARTRLAAQRVSAGPYEVKGLRAEVLLGDRVAEFRHARAQVAGGSVAATGAVLLDAKSPQVAVAAEFSDLDVSTAQNFFPDDFSHTVAGRASGVVMAALQDGQPRAEGCAVVSDAAFDDFSHITVTAQAAMQTDTLRVPWGMVQAPEATAVFCGSVGLQEDAPLDLQATVGDVDMSAVGARLKVQGLSGRVWAKLAATGTVKKPKFELTAAAFEPGFRDQRLDAAFLTASGTIEEIEGVHLVAARDGAVVEVNGRGQSLAAEKPYAQVSGSFSVRGIDLARALQWAGSPVDGIVGQAEAEGTFSGTLLDPSATGTVRLAGVTYDIYRLEQLESPFSYSAGALEIGPARGSAMGVELALSAQVTGLRGDAEGLEARATFSSGQVDLSRIILFHKYGVRIGGAARVRRAEVCLRDGRLRSASADIECRAVQLGDEHIENLALRVSTQGQVIRLEPTVFRLAGGQCRVEGEYSTETGAVSATAALDRCKIDKVLSGAAAAVPQKEQSDETAVQSLASMALRTEGLVSGQVTVAGSIEAPSVAVDVKTSQATFDGRDLPDVHLACRYLPADGRVDDVQLEAQYGEGLIIAEGSADLAGQVDILVDASDLDLKRLRQWLPAGHSIAGTLQFTCKVSGRTSAPAVRGSFDITNVNIEGVQFDLVSVPVFDVAEGGIVFDTLIFKRGEHEIKAHGRLPFTWDGPRVPTDKPVSLKASVARMDVATLFAIADEYARAKKPEIPVTMWSRLEGTGFIDAAADVAGTLEHPQISGQLAVTSASIRPEGWSRPVEDINLKVRMSPAAQGSDITIAAASARYDKTSVALSGHIGLRHAAISRMLDNSWDLELTASAPAQPLPGGGLLKNGQVRVTATSVKEGLVRVSFDKATGRLGDGSVTISGGVDVSTIELARLQKNAFDVRMAVSHAAITYHPYVRGILNGAVSVRNPGPGKDAVVRGRLRLSHAILGASPGKRAPGGELRGAPATVPQFVFDVQVAVAEDVQFKGAGVQAIIRPNPQAVVISGTPQEPRLSGSVSILRGQASMPGGLLNIEQFDVHYGLGPAPTAYEPPKLLEMRITVRGRATRVVSQVMVNDRLVGPVRIHLLVEGELPGQLQVKATSDPPLAEDQIYAILGAVPLGGFVPAAGTATQALSQRFVSLMAMGLRAGVFEPLEMKLRQLLGLAEFSISFQLNQPLEVRLGKYVAKNLLVSYRHQLGAPGEEHWWIAVSYEIMPGTVVSYYSRDDGETRFSVGVRRPL